MAVRVMLGLVGIRNGAVVGHGPVLEVNQLLSTDDVCLYSLTFSRDLHSLQPILCAAAIILLVYVSMLFLS
jgi:hypothetical protein